MAGCGGLAVYVTSHGFGHLNRTVAVLNRLPAELPLEILCHANLFDHWRERLRRPATFSPFVSDVGALNPPGDSAATDGPGTLAQAARFHAEALPRAPEEARRLRESGTAAVLCDAPAVPLLSARDAGIPGFLLANFTWADIYAPHAEKLGPEAMAFVAELRATYRRASALFRAEPALRMADLDRIAVEVGMVVTPGRDRKSELRKALGLSSREKVVYFYVGRYGQANLGWDRMARMAGLGVHFVGFHPSPEGPIPNLHVVPPAEWTGADLAASADAIVAKAGYGTACEAMIAGTPLIYPPRTGFAEHRALDRALRSWGGGLPASAGAFAAMKVETLLKRAFTLRPGPPPFPGDGAARVAERLVEACRTRGGLPR